MVNSLKQAVVRRPVDQARKSPVRALPLIRGFIPKKRFPRSRRLLSTSREVVAIPPDLRTFSPVMLLWILVAAVGLTSFWLPGRSGNKVEWSG